jgi:hypothetical protein
MSAAHVRIAHTAPRSIGRTVAVIVSGLAIGAVPGIAGAGTAMASSSKSKHHAKPVKCRKGFELKHGRCVTSVTGTY